MNLNPKKSAIAYGVLCRIEEDTITQLLLRLDQGGFTSDNGHRRCGFYWKRLTVVSILH